jgi:hypothetical protein
MSGNCLISSSGSCSAWVSAHGGMGPMVETSNTAMPYTNLQ